MKEELKIYRKEKQKEYMLRKDQTYTFMIGVIYRHDNKKIEAIKTYNIKNRECRIDSLEAIKYRMENGERIAGISLSYTLVYNSKENGYLIKSNLHFEGAIYNYKHLDVINGKGRVVHPGKEVIIGMYEGEHEKLFIAMNGNGEVRYLSKNEAIEQRLMGVTRNTICVKSCHSI